MAKRWDGVAASATVRVPSLGLAIDPAAPVRYLRILDEADENGSSPTQAAVLRGADGRCRLVTICGSQTGTERVRSFLLSTATTAVPPGLLEENGNSNSNNNSNNDSDHHDASAAAADVGDILHHHDFRPEHRFVGHDDDRGLNCLCVVTPPMWDDSRLDSDSLQQLHDEDVAWMQQPFFMTGADDECIRVWSVDRAYFRVKMT